MATALESPCFLLALPCTPTAPPLLGWFGFLFQKNVIKMQSYVTRACLSISEYDHDPLILLPPPGAGIPGAHHHIQLLPIPLTLLPHPVVSLH